jgi:dihydrolipoamide dehydrogenase
MSDNNSQGNALNGNSGNDHFQIAVIGGGPGGYVAALKAGQMGAKVALIEKGHLGGTCLNVGCIPSKALLASAELLHHIRHAGEMGIDVGGEVSVNWKKVQERKDKIITTLRGGIKGLLNARKAKLYAGTAKLNGQGKIVIAGNGNQNEITADKIILATGSTPARIPGWPTDANYVCTSDEALHWSELPKSLLIIGGGVIGCEFACTMQAFGVEVTVVEMLPRLLVNLEGMVGDAMRKTFEKRGMKILCGVKIEELKISGERILARLSNGETIMASKALVSTGRRPVTSELGLDSVGISLDRGFIRVNDRMETGKQGYYCIGDANGRTQLAHAASAHGVVAVENALGHTREFAAPIPSCVYTFPEVGAVGITTEEAQALNIPIAVGHFPLSFLGKAMAVNDTEGFARVLRHRETGVLLGVHMLGHNATEGIMAAASLLHQKATVRELAETVFAHPTIAEAIKEAAEDALYEGLHMPPRKITRVAV